MHYSARRRSNQATASYLESYASQDDYGDFEDQQDDYRVNLLSVAANYSLGMLQSGLTRLKGYFNRED